MAHVAEAATVTFARPSIGIDEIDAVVATLRSGWLTTGNRVREFEARFRDDVGAPYAIALSSCSAALHLALVVGGLGAGDEVITTPLTFCATANAIVHAGGTPVFADIDRQTMNLDPAAAAAHVTARTRALLPVHFAGRPVDVATFRTLAARHQLLLVEDAAHAVEGVSNAGRVGTTADFTCFSFYATKNLTTGEGGMLTTSSAAWAERVRLLSLHGMSREAWARHEGTGTPAYEVVTAGFKYNMMDIQAALGIQQLARLEAMLERRLAIWQGYDAAFESLPIVLPPAPETRATRHARHLYTILVEEQRCGLSRDRLAARLAERGIATSVHFRALHLHPFFAARLGLRRGMFPNAEYISDHTLSLPLSAAMTDAEVERVTDAVREVWR